jgi:hypothetical protein
VPEDALILPLFFSKGWYNTSIEAKALAYYFLAKVLVDQWFRSLFNKGTYSADY